MSQQLSPQKVTRLLSLHLAGLSESAIARKLNISQSTVSLYVSRFGAVLAQRELEAAGKEFNVMDQVQALHNLGAELRKAGLTVEEASLGVKVHRRLQALAVSDEDYPDLIAAATEMKAEGYLQAAMRLSQLEKSTGMPHEQIIATLESAKRKLGETMDQLRQATAKLNKTQAEVSAMEVKKKAASQELPDYMARVGGGMKRIEKVETLALALKAAGVTDGELDKMIRHQQCLNKAGISPANLTAILDRVAVLTSRDQGKSLLEMLSECRGLAGALDQQKTRLDALAKKADGLETKAREKAEIEAEISGLRTEKAKLEGTVAKLKEEVRPLTGLKNEVGLLSGRKADLEAEVARLDLQRRLLDRDIGLRQQEIVNLCELEARHKELSMGIDAMQAKLDHNQPYVKVLDAFVGLISSTSMDNIDVFAQALPGIIAEARLKKESPKFLTNYVLKRVTGGVLKIYSCTSCGAKFATDKPANSDLGYACPVCCYNLCFGVAEDETAILRSAMKVSQPLRAPLGAIQVAPGFIAVPRKRPNANPVP